MHWVLRFIVEKLHVPVTGAVLLRLCLVLLASAAMLAILEWRRKTLTRFLNEKSTALNLAVARVAVAATLLWQVSLHEILLNTSLNPALKIPFRIWGGLAARLVAPTVLMTAIYAVFLVSAFLMLLGLFGRIAAAVTAISAVYLISFLFLYGKVDHVYHHLVFFCLLCALFPSTDTLSLDAVLAAWRDADTGRLRRSQPSLTYGFALRCMWVFVGLAYYFPGLWKFSRAWMDWLSGKTLQDNIAWAGAFVPWSPLQLWLYRRPLLMSVASVLVVLFELGFIFVILFPRLRPLAGLVGLGFHSATDLILRISFIPLQVCYVIFFDWTAIFSWIGHKVAPGSATVRYDPHCKLCRRTAGTLAIFDWTNSLTFVPNNGELYFSVVAEDGRSAVGYEGYKLIAARLPMFWLLYPFMGLPGIQQAGTAVYKRVAASRTCGILDKTPAQGENLLPGGAPSLARWLPLAGLGLMLFFGLLHVVDTWPLSCFPPFDGPTSDSMTQLSVHTVDTANTARDWNLSADPKLRKLYQHWRWMTLQAMDSRPAARAKVAALVKLWLRSHPELHVKDATVFVDRYQMRPLEGSRVRVASRKSWDFMF